MTVGVFTCVSCGETVAPADHFCEACGVEQPSPQATTSAPPPRPSGGCADCGAPDAEIDGDGYCNQCGKKQPSARDHIELSRHGIAGASDKGHVHAQNEDAMAFARSTNGDGGWVAIVADGVSSSQRAEVASQVAVDAANAKLAPALDDPSTTLAEAIACAADEALVAVANVSWNKNRRDLGAPACTLAVAAWRPGDALTVLSVGDARCYWFGLDGASECLTDDDSWAAEQLAQGADRNVVEADNRAHAITRWLGVDAPPLDHHTIAFDKISAGGRVVVCSDGLWNFASGADELRSQFRDRDTLTDAARYAVQFANDAGGHDNITVVIATIPPASDASTGADDGTATGSEGDGDRPSGAGDAGDAGEPADSTNDEGN